MKFNKSLGSYCIQRTLSTSKGCLSYANTWKKSRRLQNPNIVENMPTNEFVKENQFKRTRMIYVCGFASTGALGLKKFYKPDKSEPDHLRSSDSSTATFRRLPEICSSDVIHDIACGYGFTIIAAQLTDTSQSALGFGLNSYSQIGYHESRPGFPLEIVASPSSITLPTKSHIMAVACGRSHSLLLDKQGQVFALGNNSLGQCGRSIDEKEVYFANRRAHLVQGLPKKIKQIECGQDHSLILTRDGIVYAFGWSADGQTGLGHYGNQIMPMPVKGDIQGAKIVKVSSSADTVLALDDQGNVFGWGNAEHSQFCSLASDDSKQFNVPRHLKLIDIPGKVIDVAAGGTMCALLNNHGQVFVWGYGILGKGPNVDHFDKPTQLAESLFGMNAYNPNTKVESIHAGLSQFAAITNVGDLYTWGRNRGNLLGFAHKQAQYFPMRVNMNMAAVKKISMGVDHTCAIVEKVC